VVGAVQHGASAPQLGSGASGEMAPQKISRVPKVMDQYKELKK